MASVCSISQKHAPDSSQSRLAKRGWATVSSFGHLAPGTAPSSFIELSTCFLLWHYATALLCIQNMFNVDVRIALGFLKV